jgi:CRP-like cAMP-binding protein
MYMNQKGILWKLDRSFVKEVMALSVKEFHKKGEALFREGNEAINLYFLTKGLVKLAIGDTGQSVYIVSHPGEIFGWSSIVGRNVYTASAECLEATSLLKINRNELLELIESDPVNGLAFFRIFSEMLGNRLLQSYALTSRYELPASQGTGQILELAEAV